jgi:hypothetical protein
VLWAPLYHASPGAFISLIGALDILDMKPRYSSLVELQFLVFIILPVVNLYVMLVNWDITFVYPLLFLRLELSKTLIYYLHYLLLGAIAFHIIIHLLGVVEKFEEHVSKDFKWQPIELFGN